MLVRFMLTAIALAVAMPPAVAQQKARQTTTKKARPAPAAPKLRHQCKVGPYEKQTRLVMETVRDKPVYIAYWSSNGPFHCSFETWPGDGRAKWIDSSAGTVISLISGTMLIEKSGTAFLVHARDVDRMPYCGTFGLINGVLTVPVKRGSECDWKETESLDAGRLSTQDPDPQLPTPQTDTAPAAPAAAGGSAS